MKCPNCNQEFTGEQCPNCGYIANVAKPKKPIFKKWWFWTIIGIVVLCAFAATDSGESTSASKEESSTPLSESISSTQAGTQYEQVSLATMCTDLDKNALKAESTYNGKMIEIEAKIVGFDSSGDYISISPTKNMSIYTSITCRVKKQHLDFLLEKETGDIITIKGKVTSVGEFLGYTIEADYVY